jgi:hypothetical protein
MPNYTVHELTKDDMDVWRREKEAYENSKTDKAWATFKKTHYVKRCACGTAYSYSKDMNDPKACQECRGETGELLY